MHSTGWRKEDVNIARIILGVAFAAALPAHAASVSYFLDQSNKLPDGTNYLQVMLTETAGGVDFLVQTLDPLNDVAGSNFGIQAFGFNFTSNTLYEITGLPDHWRARSNKQMSEFGRYDIRLAGRGNSRTDKLNFSVSGVDLSDFDDFFAARVAGFKWCFEDENNDPTGISPWSTTSWSDRKNHKDKYGWRDDGDGDERMGRNERWHGDDSDEGEWKPCKGKDCVTSAYFGGNEAVPLPTSVWLLGSGMLGFIGLMRRKGRGTSA